MPLTRQTSSSSISGAGFGTAPRAISSLDFGATLPYLKRFGGLREAVAGLQALLYTSAEHDAHVRGRGAGAAGYHCCCTCRVGRRCRRQWLTPVISSFFRGCLRPGYMTNKRILIRVFSLRSRGL